MVVAIWLKNHPNSVFLWQTTLKAGYTNLGIPEVGQNRSYSDMGRIDYPAASIPIYGAA
jgi:hypothetical protein